MTVPIFMSAVTLIAWRKDVEQALLEVIAEFGGMDTEAADEFLSELRVERPLSARCLLMSEKHPVGL